MHVILWEFTVAPEKRDAFIAAYKSDGLWARLFREANGYLGTELLFSRETGRFTTIDRWESEPAFHSFQAGYSEQYQQLDAQLEALTLTETKLGSFDAEPAEPLTLKPENASELRHRP